MAASCTYIRTRVDTLEPIGARPIKGSRTHPDTLRMGENRGQATCTISRGSVRTAGPRRQVQDCSCTPI